MSEIPSHFDRYSYTTNIAQTHSATELAAWAGYQRAHPDALAAIRDICHQQIDAAHVLGDEVEVTNFTAALEKINAILSERGVSLEPSVQNF